MASALAAPVDIATVAVVTAARTVTRRIDLRTATSFEGLDAVPTPSSSHWQLRIAGWEICNELNQEARSACASSVRIGPSIGRCDLVDRVAHAMDAHGVGGARDPGRAA